MNRTAWILPLMLSSLVVSTICAGAEAEITQTQTQYEASIRHRDYLLQITVVDDRTGGVLDRMYSDWPVVFRTEAGKRGHRF